MWTPGASTTITGPTSPMSSHDPEASSSQGRRFSQISQNGQDAAIRSDEMLPQYRLEDVEPNPSNMFRKLRKNSKQIFHSASSSKRSTSIAEDAVLPDLSYLRLGEGKLTFLDLPPEIRNVIYEDVASSTRLYVSTASAKKKEKESKIPPQTTPTLLLASRQVRIEYLPLLLECASISFGVRNFDFRNLMRVSSSLYSTELKALRNNGRLTIRLLATKPSKDSLTSLRRWAQRRTEDMYTLPLNYALAWPKLTQLVPTSGSVARINTYIQRRGILMQNLEALAGLVKEVPEALQWELQPVVEVFQRELEFMGAMGSGGRSAATRGGEQWIMPMFGRR